ncbi:zinc-ribbon domain-containing protein [Bifidobacterium callitrichidarum]|uniref:Zinc ribbon domain-containing protein n=1 Tax=Bifidobacterium callitrichidarum TaxID=2052941 RepID=A0A2U2NA56_9BIFI|nr:zinc-ribbon domain-containing protein [Bifidobacterium callitrichidarum]PWG66046.1 zinc ribbon domain-containing protein [Bifidobacterium callitrichidarum]
MYCYKCGAQSAPGQRFCPQCGTKLIAEHAPQQSAGAMPGVQPHVVPQPATVTAAASSAQSHTSRNAIIALAAVAVAIVVSIAIGFASMRYQSFQSAIDACRPKFDSDVWDSEVEGEYSMLNLGDNGKTLTITANSYNYAIADCLYDELNMPTSIQTKIIHTRAIDGTQTDKWNGITATWSFDDDTSIVILER